MFLKMWVLFVISIIIWSTTCAQKHVLDKRMHHVRKGPEREWSNFPAHSKDSQLIIHFGLKDISGSATIHFRQIDINQVWEVLLNGKKLGNLTLDEKDMTTYLEIPPGTLREKDNILHVEPERAKYQKNQVSDDIWIGQVSIEKQLLNKMLEEASVEISITDAETNQLLPSRITIVDKNGSLQPVYASNNDTLAVRTGVIYTGNGHALFSLPAGNYKIYASRGFEYGADSVVINVKPGDLIRKKLSIMHEVPAEDWISCDPHIHTFTHSGHGDASIRERVLTIAGEGLDLPIITDHNIAVDIKDTVQNMGMSSWFIPVTGNEVTTSIGHFNIFPVSASSPVTDHHVKNWNDLFDNISKSEDVKVIILNHARDIHIGFRPFDPKQHISIAGKNLTGWTFPANAMEVINSGSQQTDPKQLYLDWMGMMNRGFFLTPVGSSDSHEVSRFMVGQARTYIRDSKRSSSHVDANEAIKNFAQGRVGVSFGLLTEIIVDSLYGAGDIVPASEKLQVSLQVSGPSWVRAERVILYANGQKIREAVIPRNKTGGIKWKQKWVMPKPAHDLFLVAVAEGPGTHVPFWPIAKPFQHSSPSFNAVVLGITGAVRIDADKNGHFTTAYEYAKEIWESSGKNIDEMMVKLASYDASVAVQAAAVLTENGIDIGGSDVAETLSKVPSKVRNAFEEFIKEWRMAKDGK